MLQSQQKLAPIDIKGMVTSRVGIVLLSLLIKGNWKELTS